MKEELSNVPTEIETEYQSIIPQPKKYPHPPSAINFLKKTEWPTKDELKKFPTH